MLMESRIIGALFFVTCLVDDEFEGVAEVPEVAMEVEVVCP